MQKNIIKKGLVIAVIFLFVAVSFQPGISAVDKKTDDYDELKDSNKIGVIDEYEEFITFIKGWAKINWIERKGLFRGEANLIWNGYNPGFTNLSGFRRSDNGIEYYNELVVLEEVGFVYAHHFIGFNYPNPFLDPPPIVWGIAFGNIEWN